LFVTVHLKSQSSLTVYKEETFSFEKFESKVKQQEKIRSRYQDLNEILNIISEFEKTNVKINQVILLGDFNEHYTIELLNHIEQQKIKIFIMIFE